MPSFIWILLIHAVVFLVFARANDYQERRRQERRRRQIARREHEASIARVEAKDAG
jgi:Flp pilus assembly protein TadB